MNKNISTDSCELCGTSKMKSSSCVGYLCGKCYLAKKQQERIDKGLKWKWMVKK